MRIPKPFTPAAVGVLTWGLLVIASCAGQMKEIPPAANSVPYQLESEGTIPPLNPAEIRREVDKTEIVEEMPMPTESVAVESVKPIQATVRPRPAEPQAVRKEEGYRVQILATGNTATAESVRQAIEVRLGVPAYVEFIDAVYKVRVGNCRVRAEAEALLTRCQEAGYADAWIVASEVVVETPRP